MFLPGLVRRALGFAACVLRLILSSRAARILGLLVILAGLLTEPCLSGFLFDRVILPPGAAAPPNATAVEAKFVPAGWRRFFVVTFCPALERNFPVGDAAAAFLRAVVALVGRASGFLAFAGALPFAAAFLPFGAGI